MEPRISFMALPPELRVQIYSYVIQDQFPLRYQVFGEQHISPSIFQVSRQIYAESRPIFYETKIFKIDCDGVQHVRPDDRQDSLFCMARRKLTRSGLDKLMDLAFSPAKFQDPALRVRSCKTFEQQFRRYYQEYEGHKLYAAFRTFRHFSITAGYDYGGHTRHYCTLDSEILDVLERVSPYNTVCFTLTMNNPIACNRDDFSHGRAREDFVEFLKKRLDKSGSRIEFCIETVQSVYKSKQAMPLSHAQRRVLEECQKIGILVTYPATIPTPITSYGKQA